MNWKKFILLSCAAPCLFAASTATAQMMGHHPSIGQAPMQRAPISTSGRGFRRFGDGDFDRDDGFRHNRTFIFIDSFGFPFFAPFPYYGYYPYPSYSYYPSAYYPDGSYGYGNYGGSTYGYGYGGRSEIVAAQRRLARAGYYHGAIDGILGPQTRRAIRAYERDHNTTRYGGIDRIETSTYVNHV